MPLEPFLLTYAGLASFAASTARVRSDLRRDLPDPMVMKIMGALILLAGLWRAIVRFGPHEGPVAWVGLLCLSGVAMVLLASRRKDWAMGLSLPALAIAGVTILAAG